MLEYAHNLLKCCKSFSLLEIPKALDLESPKHCSESRHSITGVNGASASASSRFGMYIPI